MEALPPENGSNGRIASNGGRRAVQSVAVANHKGGVGKTTTAVCLSGALIERDKRVLLIDLDEQGSASDWLGTRDTQPGAALLSTIAEGGDLTPLIEETVSGVDLIACGEAFHGYESAVAGEAGKEFMLRDAIASIPDDRYDYVVFDCPPSLNLLTASALVASDFMLVPVEAKFMSLRPLARLMKLFDGVQRRLNPDLRLAGVVGCKVKEVKARSRHPAEIIERMREAFGDAVFSTMIRDAIRLGEAPGHQKTIGLYDPSGNAAGDYRGFAEEFEQRMKALTRKRRVANA
jgi:chromosome partitioning protein